MQFILVQPPVMTHVLFGSEHAKVVPLTNSNDPAVLMDNLMTEL